MRRNLLFYSHYTGIEVFQMKLLSFVVPCYNSAAYMRHCIDTLLLAGDCAEILIVNDGSADTTAQIADEYAAAHPGIVRAIHQPNKGHGGAVNAGIANAQGEYLKVVDSDDHLDGALIPEYIRLLTSLRGQIDLLITNYVYDKQGKKHKTAMRYGDMCPKNRIFGWQEMKWFRPGEVMLMHSMTYRTQLLRDCGLRLPEHTFYVDNVFAYIPLAHVERMYYADLNLYRYFIGRADQSVNEATMVRRQDQQLRVMRELIHGCNLDTITPEKRRGYMTHNLGMIMVVTSILLIIDGSERALAKKKAIWAELAGEHPASCRRIRRSITGIFACSESRFVQRAGLMIYNLVQRIYGFN